MSALYREVKFSSMNFIILSVKMDEYLLYRTFLNSSLSIFAVLELNPGSTELILLKKAIISGSLARFIS